MDPTRPFWLTAFLDFPAAEFDRGAGFWARATGWPLSQARGEHDEFASFLPPAGADYLRLQRLGAGETRVHLDVHVPDPEEAALAAHERGARIVRQAHPGLVVMQSPAGFDFCLNRQDRRGTPEPQAWASGHRSRVSQLCLDVPPEAHLGELEFWTATLSGRVRPSANRAEFSWIDLDGEFPIRVLVQRLDLAARMSAHLDIGTDDRTAEVARLTAQGALVRAVRDGWTVLEAPGGTSFCVLDGGL